MYFFILILFILTVCEGAADSGLYLKSGEKGNAAGFGL